LEGKGKENQPSIFAAPLWLYGFLQPGLDPAGEGAEVADALHLVIRQLNAKVVFEAREQFEGLQAVDIEFLVEIVARLEVCPPDFEVVRRQIQDFLGCLFEGFHEVRVFRRRLFYPNPDGATADTDGRLCFQ
jgi:hypothetical protein